MKTPCVRCGHLLNTGEGRVIVAFLAAELAELACQTTDVELRRRLLCALGLIDQNLEGVLRGAVVEADNNKETVT